MLITENHASMMRAIGVLIVLLGNKIIQLYTAPHNVVTIPVKVEKSTLFDQAINALFKGQEIEVQVL